MTKMIKINNINQIIKFFLFFSFLICWFSISSSFNDLLIFNEEKKLNYIDILNFLRHILVYLCLFFLITIFFIFKKFFLRKNYLIYFFFIGYLLAQIPGLIITDNSITNISFMISALAIVLTMILVNHFFSDNEKKVFNYLSFFFLITVFSITFLPQFKNFFMGGDYFYGLYKPSDIFLTKIQPRSSGLSRIALLSILFIFSLEVTFIKKKSLIIELIKIFLLTSILLLQSRTIIFLTFISFGLIFIFNFKILIKNILKYLFIYLLIPIILALALSNINQFNDFKKKTNKEFSTLSDVKNFIEFSTDKEKSQRNLRTMSKDISSGRFDDWRLILKNINNNNIYFGFGSQGDRFLINQSASNGFIYAYSSSGIVGLAFFILFSFFLLYKIFKSIVFSFRKDLVNYIYCVILLVLFLRSFLETSFAVFSIDLIIFISLLNIINDNKTSIEVTKKGI